MKIMMIDPWGINNLLFYTNGLCSGISKYGDLTLVTNCYYEKTTDSEYTIMPLFFKKSEGMEDGMFRKIIRGAEYISAYIRIIKELKKNSYDIVHVQWLLNYKMDVQFLSIIKKYCKKLVYTAHNVLPHINGNQYVDDLKTIYSIVDTIVLHGEGIREEFKKLFGEFNYKVVIQRHGTYLNQDTQYDRSSIGQEILETVEKYNKVFIFFGHIFYNKGVDRVTKMWIESFSSSENLLVIAGKKSSEYKELEVLEDKINNCKNILYISKFVEDNLLNYLITKSDIIILPYRHASMSGVIFTAAEFNKTVLCTNVGAISEYVVDEENSYVVENNDDEFFNKLKYISNEVSKESLSVKGKRLHEYIVDNYSWNNIGKDLVEIYKIENRD